MQFFILVSDAKEAKLFIDRYKFSIPHKLMVAYNNLGSYAWLSHLQFEDDWWAGWGCAGCEITWEDLKDIEV